MENLDCIDKDELYDRFCQPTVEQICRKEELSLKGARLYKRYAIHKYAAILARLEGNISQALLEEKFCDQIYRNISKGEQW